MPWRAAMSNHILDNPTPSSTARITVPERNFVLPPYLIAPSITAGSIWMPTSFIQRTVEYELSIMIAASLGSVRFSVTLRKSAQN